jgi:hypothetical protein
MNSKGSGLERKSRWLFVVIGLLVFASSALTASTSASSTKQVVGAVIAALGLAMATYAFIAGRRGKAD